MSGRELLVLQAQFAHQLFDQLPCLLDALFVLDFRPEIGGNVFIARVAECFPNIRRQTLGAQVVVSNGGSGAAQAMYQLGPYGLIEQMWDTDLRDSCPQGRCRRAGPAVMHNTGCLSKEPWVWYKSDRVDMARQPPLRQAAPPMLDDSAAAGALDRIENQIGQLSSIIMEHAAEGQHDRRLASGEKLPQGEIGLPAGFIEKEEAQHMIVGWLAVCRRVDVTAHGVQRELW
jgi:hypothetical protein